MKTLGLLILTVTCLVSYLVANGNDDIVSIAKIIFIPCAIALYFYPTICAAGENPRRPMIFVLNLLVGWTVIGWIGAFIWAQIPPRDNADIKVCPYCAEIIKAAAKKCPICKSDLEQRPI